MCIGICREKLYGLLIGCASIVKMFRFFKRFSFVNKGFPLIDKSLGPANVQLHRLFISISRLFVAFKFKKRFSEFDIYARIVGQKENRLFKERVSLTCISLGIVGIKLYCSTIEC